MQALEKITYSNNWITIILLFLYVSIVFLKLLDSKKLKESFFTFFNFSFIEDEDIESPSFFSTFQIVIFLFSIAVLSLLTYYFKVFRNEDTIKSFTTFFSIFLGVFSYFFIKRVLEYLLAHLFLIKRSLQVFLTTKANYLYSISFLIYISLILCEYAKMNVVFIFYFAAFLFLARFIFYSVRNKKLIFNKLFYFILYICAFEIAPLFVLFKLMF